MIVSESWEDLEPYSYILTIEEILKRGGATKSCGVFRQDLDGIKFVELSVRRDFLAPKPIHHSLIPIPSLSGVIARSIFLFTGLHHTFPSPQLEL